MGLWVPKGVRQYQWHVSTYDGVTPGTSIGVSVAPGTPSNTMGSWTQLLSGATVARDVWAVEVTFSNNAVGSSFNRNTLVDIGIDSSGGTSYTTLIPTLLASYAGDASLGGRGVTYWFPIRIPAGSSIAARAQQNNGSPGSPKVNITVYGAPSDRTLIRAGSGVIAYGVATGSSGGTTVTPGTAAEGSWASLGTTTKDHWYWQIGFGSSSNSMSSTMSHCDLGVGDASNKFLVIDNASMITVSSNGSILKPLYDQSYYASKSGDIVYGRMWSNSAPTGIQMAAYAVYG